MTINENNTSSRRLKSIRTKNVQKRVVHFCLNIFLFFFLQKKQQKLNRTNEKVRIQPFGINRSICEHPAHRTVGAPNQQTQTQTKTPNPVL